MTPADLRAARLRLGLTQTAFGAAVGGYYQETVARWEREGVGGRKVPKAVAVLVGRMLADEAKISRVARPSRLRRSRNPASA